jgi:MFS family permease
LNNQFDNKILYLIAVAIFKTGSAIIGAAPRIEAIVVGRVIAGIGGSGIYVGTMNIMSAVTLPVERPAYLNYVGIAWSLGAILGPIIGGAFADSSATWRWAFYVNIVIAAVAAPVCIYWIPPVIPPRIKEGVWLRIRQIDFIGALLFQGGVVCIVAILGFGGVLYSWSSGQMIGLYVALVVAWTAFSLQQRFRLFTVDRIFPLQFVADWEMVLLFCWTAVDISNVTVTIYSLPLLFQFAFNDSPLHAAVWTLPFIGAMLASGGPLGPVFPKFSVYKVWYGVSSILMLISGGLMSTLNFYTSRGTLCGLMVLQGIGCGPVINLGFTVGQAKVPRSSVGQVAAFLTCAQMAALAITLGIATNVFINTTTADIMAFLPNLSVDDIRNTINGVDSTVFDQLKPEDKMRVAETVARNIGKVFYMNIAGAAFGLACTLVMKFERVDLSVKANDESGV